MTLTLDIKQETKAELDRQASAEGLSVEAYAASLLEEAAQEASPPTESPLTAKNLVELFAPVRGLNLDLDRDRDTGRDINL